MAFLWQKYIFCVCRVSALYFVDNSKSSTRNIDNGFLLWDGIAISWKAVVKKRPKKTKEMLGEEMMMWKKNSDGAKVRSFFTPLKEFIW